MIHSVSTELEVDLPADDIWAVYSSPELPKLVVKLMPHVYDKIDIVEGDGGVGTVLQIVLTPEMMEPRTWKEKFVEINDGRRKKVVRQIEGGYLDMGFHFYEDIFKIKKKSDSSCIIKSKSVFRVDHKHKANASLVTPDASAEMAKAVAEYAKQKKANSSSSSKDKAKACYE
ncbi:PREDICTED: S-norcoclaurine synthase 2-like [Nelumbo nucifera]|uniref:S-norcoclaurine synthase 2-like n=1 Tax=Nelumbo nucifera TaxID=4432 RepID=A0A182C8V5_NELNU|nr:PREDICTED: S-norcoclaurine synthase 2-like [Nelumbo nucifera]AND61511.1 S-norcoclaurine synthase 5 [Nelumbo nucifera]